jgi:cell division septation protein DedD
VRNAAMKKLFTDPHYNVMDRLDIYIDDYSLPDPLPESMLRQMASAKFLNLFDDEDAETAPPSATAVATPDATPDATPLSAALPTPSDNAPAPDDPVSAVLTPSTPAASPAANLAS